MKKTFFNPGAINAYRLPVIQSRRIFGSNRTGKGVTSAYLKGNDDDDDDDDAQEKLLIKRIMKNVRADLANRAKQEDIDQIVQQLEFLKPGKDGKGGFPIETLREMADPTNGVMTKLVAQGLEIQELRTKITASDPKKDMSVRGQCEDFLTRNKAVIDRIRKGQKQSVGELEEFELDVRAAASYPMTSASVMPSGTAYIQRYEVQPGIIGDLRAEPTFWDFITKGSTNSPTYFWVNKRPTDGEAGWIGPGVFKPSISFSFVTETSIAKKIADSAKMPTELLEDIDGFASYVETELRYMLMQKANDTLMDNVESNTEVGGIKQVSVTYEPLTGISTTNANIWDAIKAAVTMLRVSKFRGRIVTFINPVDLANAVMTKAQNQGQLFIPPATGSTIVEDLNLPLGTINVVAMDYYKLLIYKPFRMFWGLENDDFTKNLVTAISEMRVHNFHSENHDGFSIYDTLANIITAINVVIP